MKKITKSLFILLLVVLFSCENETSNDETATESQTIQVNTQDISSKAVTLKWASAISEYDKTNEIVVDIYINDTKIITDFSALEQEYILTELSKDTEYEFKALFKDKTTGEILKEIMYIAKTKADETQTIITLDAISITHDQVDLTWTTDITDVTGYSIAIEDASGMQSLPLTLLEENVSLYTLNSLIPGDYTATLTAHTVSGDFVEQVFFSIAQPVGNITVDVISITHDQVELTWMTDMTDVTGYSIAIEDASGTQSLPLLLEENVSSYIYTNLMPGDYTATLTAHTISGDFVEQFIFSIAQHQ